MFELVSFRVQEQQRMKKIKYGNRKSQNEHRELDNLREGDQICEGVLDTLSDDYINYINHLIKNSKTPQKKQSVPQPQSPSSQQQVQTNHKTQHYPINQKQPEARTRHHSQTGPKKNQHVIFQSRGEKMMKCKAGDQDIPKRLSQQKETINKDKNIAQRRKRKKLEVYPLETALKNQQKTMSFSRNYAPPLGDNPFQDTCYPKCYTNQPESEHSNEKASINFHLQHTNSREAHHPFIFQLDSYISHLQAKPNQQSQARPKSKSRIEGSRNKRSIKYYEDDEQSVDVQEVLKQNLKLHKKVKTYEQKIDELQDQVSSHLLQCKKRDKDFKNKISNLVKALTQSISKMNQQKQQIGIMKNLLRSFGQKVKQIEHEEEDSEEGEEEISESIIKYMNNVSTSDGRNKYRRKLQSTMPRRQDQIYWKE